VTLPEGIARGRAIRPLRHGEGDGRTEEGNQVEERKEEAMSDRFGLTPKQHQLLQFLRARESQGLPAPSLDEMAAAVGLESKSGAHRLVAGLVERGYVRRMLERKRSVRVIDRAHPVADQVRDALVAAVAALPQGCRLTPMEVMALIRETALVWRRGEGDEVSLQKRDVNGRRSDEGVQLI
jgi:DNA-binding MarR family transcriptional regulator